MTKLDWEQARGQRRLPRPGRPIGVVVRPARSGKRYETLRQAENAARYVNEWGQQRDRYEWFVRETDDGAAFELWRRPRVQGRR